VYNTFLFNETVLNLDILPSLNHYLVDCSYRFLNKTANHVLVIGKDGKEDLVFGESEDTWEELAAGERLTFKLMAQLGSESEVDAAAEAILSEQRLYTVQGFLTCPPNCGAELYDVIRIYDNSLSFSEGIAVRITGIENKYNALTGRFMQRLYLCAV
jgi:hypothetical protein